MKWFALCFGAFFALSSGLQYVWLRNHSQSIITGELRENAAKISKATEYNNGIDPAHYFKAEFDTQDFVSVLSDGTVLEVDVGPHRPIGALRPNAVCPILSAAAFSAPLTKAYEPDTIRSETWRIMAKKVAGGYVIVGFSALDEVASEDEKLAASLALFGDTLGEPTRANRSKMDNNLSWAVLSDAHELVSADGRLPLKTDAMHVGRVSTSNSEHEILHGQVSYLVVYLPLLDVIGHPAGTIIQFKDVTLEDDTLRQQVFFNMGVALASFAVFLALAAFYSARKEGEKRALREAFQHYFSSQIMEAILREPELLKLGGQRREVTILFSDIRSFTGLTEKLPPQQLTRLLQEYFDAMTDEVFATEGVVDKYVGDAIMAFWGAPIAQPDQADRAVQTAINMVKRLKQLQDKWQAEGVPGPLDAGIGINLGIATVGNLGSSRRFDYTLIGDVVNAASRIEQMNKEYLSHIIISDTTKAQLTITVPTKDLGEVQVRGRERPIRVYEVEVAA